MTVYVMVKLKPCSYELTYVKLTSTEVPSRTIVGTKPAIVGIEKVEPSSLHKDHDQHFTILIPTMYDVKLNEKIKRDECSIILYY